MESDKISKCYCDLFKIQKKTSNCVVTCYHKSVSTPSLQCLTRKWEETIVSSAERKSCKCHVKCKLNRASPVPPHIRRTEKHININFC